MALTVEERAKSILRILNKNERHPNKIGQSPNTKVLIDNLNAVIREEREACTKLVAALAEKCPEFGTGHSCESFGCPSLYALAVSMRART